MQVLQDVELKDYTTFKMGGKCRSLYIPESQDELINLASQQKRPLLLIGGGSNLLINDTKVFDDVVLLREFNDTIQHLGNGEFVVGASVRLQKLIRTINGEGYGGIEYLYSVPALLGGAVYMNAGTGKATNKCISDFLVNVDVLHNGEVKTLLKEECDFSYRHSIFKNGEYLILSARFRFPYGKREDFEALIRERLEHCKVHQDASKPNFGTVFSNADNRIMRLMAKLDKKSSGVHFSQKTRNWLVNERGTFKQALSRLRRVRLLHKLIAKPCSLEVIIWK